jgi:hypothetical protein
MILEPVRGLPRGQEAEVRRRLLGGQTQAACAVKNTAAPSIVRNMGHASQDGGIDAGQRQLS